MESTVNGSASQSRLPAAPAGDAAWLVFPADTGRCGGQAARMLDEARIHVCAEDGWRVGLACFLILLHRHTQQSSVTIGVHEAAAVARVASFEFQDPSTVDEVVRACAVLGAVAGVGPIPTVFLGAEQLTPQGQAVLAQADLGLAWIDRATHVDVTLS